MRWHGKRSHSELILYLAEQYIKLEGIESIPGDSDEEELEDKDDELILVEFIENVHPSELSHTKPISVRIGDFETDNCSWQDVMFETLRRIFDSGVSPRHIVNSMEIPASTDDSLDPKYPKDRVTGISHNPRSTPRLWEEIRNLSETFGINVEVHFRWTNNRKASYPGHLGTISNSIKPNSDERTTKVVIPALGQISGHATNVPETISSDNIHLLSDTKFLKHTYVMDASIDKRFTKSVSWTEILKSFLITLAERCYFTTRELISEVELPITEGEVDLEYYSYIAELDCSIKYCTATEITRELIRLSNSFNIPIQVRIRWTDDAGAMFAGQQSIVSAGNVSESSSER